MTRSEAIEKYVIPAIERTWNEKNCKKILEALERESCEDAISRQAAIDDLKGKDPSQIWDTADVETWINSLPSSQPEIAKRIVGKSRDGMALWYQCDMCNEPVDAQDNFCRGCGRRLTDG